jgi:UDP-2-acetamido-3-amino-2,3-dideoxy-glucuronate N-acetyltransferase
MRYSDEYGRVEMYFAASLPEPGEFSYHSTACIAARTIIGAGTKIWHFTHVMPCAQIGRDCVLGQGVHVATGVKIGNNCRIQNHVSLFTGVELADSVFIGPGAAFTNVLTPRAFVPRKGQFKQTIV